MKTIAVNKPKLVDAMYACLGKIKYKLGAKAHWEAEPLEHFWYIDCSGFARWLLFRCSGIKMPDGSYLQRKWCQEQGFKENPYNMVAGLKDNRLRIAFMNAKNGRPGHVWFIINGKTIESYSKKGVSRRNWNTWGLKKNVDFCFTLTDKLDN